MTCAPISAFRSLLRYSLPSLCGLLLGTSILTGCAGQTGSPARGSNAYSVNFSATRTADHTALATVSVPVTLGSEARTKTTKSQPTENQPVLAEFVVRLQRTRQPGVYELVTRATAREAIRNKKGKLKLNKRYIGALVPTRLGETQVVSTDADPIHLEAQLERR